LARHFSGAERAGAAEGASSRLRFIGATPKGTREMPALEFDPSNPLVAYGAWIASAPGEWPREALHAARRAFVDTIGVAIPGAAEPVTGVVLAAVSDWGEGPCTAIGSAARLPAPWAALVGGTAAHALDFDDNFDPPKAHASAVLVPAILALGEQEGASGKACLDAYIVGLQVMGRVGQGVNPVHRNRGWHATGTVGAIGAAAACARLTRLTAEQAAYALSIATSMAGGFMSQFGTMTKPLHAGLAAKAGVMASSLAKAGLDAGLGTLDGPKGMNRLMVGPDYEALRDSQTCIDHGQTMRFETDSVGEPLLILSSGLKVKRFPNCGSAHRAMDGLLELRERLGFAADELAEVRVSAPATHLANLMYEDPQTPAQARFSLEFALATIALKGKCALSDFEPEAVADPQVRAICEIVRRVPVDKPEGEFPTRVEVTLSDGRKGDVEVTMPVGSLNAPLSDAQQRAKFEQCAAGLVSDGDRAALLAKLDGLVDLADIRSLTALLAR
jgi:2-methylcitrate dehydratase PrpD